MFHLISLFVVLAQAWVGSVRGPIQAKSPRSVNLQPSQEAMRKPALVWVPIPEGILQSQPHSRPKLSPRRLQMAAFEMGETEVTVSQYKACEAVGVCTAAQTGDYCNAGQAGKENHPINCVNFQQAQAFCRWMGARLPTESEWDYVARGRSGSVYPWGNKPPQQQVCWQQKDGTCVVGSYPKTLFGKPDKHGLADLGGERL